MAEIGRKLNVESVLEGSVRKAGSRVRITAQLVHVQDGYPLWSERFDRELDDVFAIQEEIALAIAEKLRVDLTASARESLARYGTANLEAHDAYLLGLHELNRRTTQSVEHAIQHFERAVELDPEFAEAYTGLADALSQAALGLSTLPDSARSSRSKRAAERAVALDPNLPNAHTSIGYCRLLEWDLAGAETAFARSLELSPNYAKALQWQAQLLQAKGEYEASRKSFRRALECDPLSIVIRNEAGWPLIYMGRHAEAVDHYKGVLEDDPSYGFAHYNLGNSYDIGRQYAAAIECYDRAITIMGRSPFILAWLARAHTLDGQTREALEIKEELLELAASSDGMFLFLAVVCDAMEETEEALDWLERAVQARNPLLVDAVARNRYLPLDNIRDEPRFRAILKKVTARASGAQRRGIVGRDESLTVLSEALESTSEHGVLATVAGEPGIGKTTLVDAFLKELDGAAIGRGRCSERLAGTEAYLPILECLESLEASSEASAGLLERVAPGWKQLLEGHFDASLVQEKLKRELSAFLHEASQSQRVILVLEDVHWADTSTVDVLGYLAARFDTVRALVIATYRPEELKQTEHSFLDLRLDLQSKGLCRDVPIGFLSAEAVAEYLDRAYQGHRFPARLAKTLHERTEGSPLFLVDVLGYWKDEGVLALRNGAWEIRGSVETLPELPTSVRGMIERKLGKLSDEHRKLLVTASVQGEVFDSPVVADAAGIDPEAVEDHLEVLDRDLGWVRLLAETELPDKTLSLRYRFVHVLYQNALYGTLKPTRRAKLSLAVADSLTRHHGDAVGKLTVELAYLFEDGRDFERASSYFLQTAKDAVAVAASSEAILLARHGLEVLVALPRSRERDEKELELSCVLAPALTVSRAYADSDVKKVWSQAKELGYELEAIPEMFAALWGLWGVRAQRGELREARVLATELLTIAKDFGEPGLLLGAHSARGLSYFAGALVGAREHLEAIHRLYRPERDHVTAAVYGIDIGAGAWAHYGCVLAIQGFVDQAVEAGRKAIAVADDVSHPFSMAYVLRWVAMVHGLRRDPEAIERSTQQTLTISERHGFAAPAVWATVLQGAACVAHGRYEKRAQTRSFVASECGRTPVPASSDHISSVCWRTRTCAPNALMTGSPRSMMPWPSRSNPANVSLRAIICDSRASFCSHSPPSPPVKQNYYSREPSTSHGSSRPSSSSFAQRRAWPVCCGIEAARARHVNGCPQPTAGSRRLGHRRPQRCEGVARRARASAPAREPEIRRCRSLPQLEHGEGYGIFQRRAQRGHHAGPREDFRASRHLASLRNAAQGNR